MRQSIGRYVLTYIRGDEDYLDARKRFVTEFMKFCTYSIDAEFNESIAKYFDSLLDKELDVNANVKTIMSQIYEIYEKFKSNLPNKYISRMDKELYHIMNILLYDYVYGYLKHMDDEFRADFHIKISKALEYMLAGKESFETKKNLLWVEIHDYLQELTAYTDTVIGYDVIRDKQYVEFYVEPFMFWISDHFSEIEKISRLNS